MRTLTPITIRPAVEADQATIKSMIHAARLMPRKLYRSRFLVAEEGGRIVGIRQIKFHRRGTREVSSGVVLPEYRRRGISARLMHALLDQERGPLYLRCNEKWARYYEQFGFNRVKPSELPSDFRRDYRMVRFMMSVLSLFVRRDINVFIPMKRSARRSTLTTHVGKRNVSGAPYQSTRKEVTEMREVCYCGRTGEVESREPVLNNDGRQALRCPECGHTDRLEWL
ncbi:MAG: GNAT family N-acetyltransferase, partial [Actinobacteria bacterium]|nr:GNAT family N-acetyltransferase [Actinomycetota bacterium]